MNPINIAFRSPSHFEATEGSRVESDGKLEV